MVKNTNYSFFYQIILLIFVERLWVFSQSDVVQQLNRTNAENTMFRNKTKQNMYLQVTDLKNEQKTYYSKFTGKRKEPTFMSEEQKEIAKSYSSDSIKESLLKIIENF